jgi:hypothetical protein
MKTRFTLGYCRHPILTVRALWTAYRLYVRPIGIQEVPGAAPLALYIEPLSGTTFAARTYGEARIKLVWAVWDKFDK